MAAKGKTRNRRMSEAERKALAREVFALMHDDESIVSFAHACRTLGVSADTVTTIVNAFPDDIKKEYAHAREMMVDRIAVSALSIADEEVGSTTSGGMDSAAIQRNRLRFDARKWLLSKIAPRKYGDKVGQAEDDDEGEDMISGVTIEVKDARRQA